MHEHLLTQAEHGGSVRVAIGDTILVRLHESPTTGYRWQFELPAALSLSADDFVVAGVAAGAGGERVIRLLASAPGCHELRATLRRSWLPDAEPSARFAVTVDVA